MSEVCKQRGESHNASAWAKAGKPQRQLDGTNLAANPAPVTHVHCFPSGDERLSIPAVIDALMLASFNRTVMVTAVVAVLPAVMVIALTYFPEVAPITADALAGQ